MAGAGIEPGPVAPQSDALPTMLSGRLQIFMPLSVFSLLNNPKYLDPYLDLWDCLGREKPSYTGRNTVK